ncbi:helix-turn-helix domain-containing protein [Dokdonia ponticola]|uniref:Helix-turn-helix domain-containing protein n=1 Tax=Dokdonia ponticola TaxID=2041041 RepID=A0ABV9I3Q2_9FLAO
MICAFRLRAHYIQLLFILFFIVSATSQEEKSHTLPDSLSYKTYDYLSLRIHENSADTIASIRYINSYLAKAIHEDNGYRRHRGYILLSRFTKDKDAKYTFIEKALLDIKSLDEPNLIYLYRHLGTVYYSYFEYEAALEYYLKALKIARHTNKEKAEYTLLYNIALIKERIGKHNEALSLYKKCLVYETHTKDTIGSIITTIAIAKSMHHNKKYDSASHYYKKISDKLHQLPPIYGSIAAVDEGINLYAKKKYKKAEQLLIKEYSQINFTLENQKHYILATLYLGKTQLALYSNEEKAKEYFTKVDSLVSQSKAIIPETIDAYEFLIKYNKKRKNLKEQLNAVTKLSQLIATISSRKINTIDIMHAEFDVPQLLKSKEILIEQLENKSTTNSVKIVYLIVFILLLITLFILQYKRHLKYKNRFNTIISELNKNEKKSTLNPNTSNAPKLLLEGIDKETVTSVLKKLDQFEEKRGFLQKDITLTILAKKCDTNTKYLPRIIHAHKDKSFVNYINNLRIDYIIKEMIENTILQKYTIKTISEEAGFNTAESFARAFKNKTGIRPSYYIRKLKKEETS